MSHDRYISNFKTLHFLDDDLEEDTEEVTDLSPTDQEQLTRIQLQLQQHLIDRRFFVLENTIKHAELESKPIHREHICGNIRIL